MCCHVDAMEGRRRKIFDNRLGGDESDVMTLAPSERELDGERHAPKEKEKTKGRKDRQRKERMKKGKKRQRSSLQGG